MSKQVECKWTWDAEPAFQKVETVLTNEPILKHFELAEPIILQNNINGLAIAGILNRYDSVRIPSPLNLYSRKCSAAKHNQERYDYELVVVM